MDSFSEMVLQINFLGSSDLRSFLAADVYFSQTSLVMKGGSIINIVKEPVRDLSKSSGWLKSQNTKP